MEMENNGISVLKTLLTDDASTVNNTGNVNFYASIYSYMCSLTCKCISFHFRMGLRRNLQEHFTRVRCFKVYLLCFYLK